MPGLIAKKAHIKYHAEAHDFRLNNERYLVLRFPEPEQRPSFLQSVSIALESVDYRMLTAVEARQLIRTSRGRERLQRSMKGGDWGYLDDPIMQAREATSVIYNAGFESGFHVVGFGPNNPAKIIILKEVSRQEESGKSCPKSLTGLKRAAA